MAVTVAQGPRNQETPTEVISVSALASNILKMDKQTNQIAAKTNKTKMNIVSRTKELFLFEWLLRHMAATVSLFQYSFVHNARWGGM